MIGLTAKQADVLHYVAGYLEAHDGISPTYQSICDALGIGSKNTVDRHLNQLEASGLLTRMKRREQAIEIIWPVAIPRTPEGAPLYFVRIAR